jgi:hypothetical protein
VASAARRAAVVGLGAGGQPALQVEGLGALEDGLLLRQSTLRTPRLARPADGAASLPLLTSTAMSAGAAAQAIAALPKAGLAALAQVEEAHHLAGADVGHGFEVGALDIGLPSSRAAGARC